MRGQLSEYDAVIWDEGVVHAAHNLFVHAKIEPNTDDVVAFARLVPKPDQLIWVTAPTAQSTQVLLKRGHSRVGGTPLAAGTFAEHAQATFEILSSVDGLSERIHPIDNAAPIEDPAVAIQERARAIGAFLIDRMQQSQEPQPRAGASLCLTA